MTPPLRRGAVIVSVLAALGLGLVSGSSPAAGAPPDPSCQADKPQAHHPKADLKFGAILNGRKGTRTGDKFDWGDVNTLLIEVRWEKLQVSGRQRVELYTPNGHLYQMFSKSLPPSPDPIDIQVPVDGSWIRAYNLAGAWCVKVFLDDEPEPVAADGFELKR